MLHDHQSIHQAIASPKNFCVSFDVYFGTLIFCYGDHAEPTLQTVLDYLSKFGSFRLANDSRRHQVEASFFELQQDVKAKPCPGEIWAVFKFPSLGF
jgi:hypothetical protein